MYIRYMYIRLDWSTRMCSSTKTNIEFSSGVKQAGLNSLPPLSSFYVLLFFIFKLWNRQGINPTSPMQASFFGKCQHLHFTGGPLTAVLQNHESDRLCPWHSKVKIRGQHSHGKTVRRLENGACHQLCGSWFYLVIVQGHATDSQCSWSAGISSRTTYCSRPNSD